MLKPETTRYSVSLSPLIHHLAAKIESINEAGGVVDEDEDGERFVSVDKITSPLQLAEELMTSIALTTHARVFPMYRDCSVKSTTEIFKLRRIPELVISELADILDDHGISVTKFYNGINATKWSLTEVEIIGHSMHVVVGIDFSEKVMSLLMERGRWEGDIYAANGEVLCHVKKINLNI